MEGYFIAEIRMFGGTFAPANWAFCHGQLLSINDYTAVFALIGTIYGGNGQTNFALPDFRGRIPVGSGSNGLGSFVEGQAGGVSSTTLTVANMPAHNHGATAQIKVSPNSANLTNPIGNVYGSGGSNIYAPVATGSDNLGGVTGVVTATGSGTPFSNTMPSLGVSMVFCLFGIFPSRN